MKASAASEMLEFEGWNSIFAQVFCSIKMRAETGCQFRLGRVREMSSRYFCKLRALSYQKMQLWRRLGPALWSRQTT